MARVNLAAWRQHLVCPVASCPIGMGLGRGVSPDGRTAATGTWTGPPDMGRGDGPAPGRVDAARRTGSVTVLQPGRLDSPHRERFAG